MPCIHEQTMMTERCPSSEICFCRLAGRVVAARSSLITLFGGRQLHSFELCSREAVLPRLMYAAAVLGSLLENRGDEVVQLQSVVMCFGPSYPNRTITAPHHAGVGCS